MAVPTRFLDVLAIETVYFCIKKFNMFINGTLKAIICMQNVLREFELHNS